MKDKIIYTILILLGISLIVYYKILVFNIGVITFSKVLYYIGICMCIIFTVGLYTDYVIKSNNTIDIIKKIIRILIYIGFSIFFITEIFIVILSFQKNMDRVDYTIILGASLDGKNMSTILKQRVDTALMCYEFSNNSGVIVASGGKNKYELVAESKPMSEYLIKNKVKSKDILVEDKSTDTYENLFFCKNIIEEHSGRNISEVNVKIVSSRFHLFRSFIVGKSLGYKNIKLCGSCISPILIPTYYFREFIGFYKMLIFDIIL